MTNSNSIKKSIAFLTHPYHRGGVTRWMVDAAEEFSDAGYEVYFITVKIKKEFIPGPTSPSIISLFKSKNSNIRIYFKEVTLPFILGTQGYKAHVYDTLIKKYVPSEIPIIISDDVSVWQASALNATRNPMIAVMHSDNNDDYSQALKYYNNVSLYISVSERIRKNCLDFFSTNDLYMPVISCGIPLLDLKRDQIKKDQKLINLAWVGRVEERSKRVSDLIKIAIELREKQILFHLHIIGNGPEYDWVIGQINKYALHQHITLHGWMNSENINKMLRQSDILLLTSNFEGMPIVLMEALSNGCPVVSSRVSGVEDLEHHPLAKECLKVYPIGQVSDAVQSIIETLKIPRAIQTEVARKLAEEELSISVCIRKYASILNPTNFYKSRQDLSITALWTQAYVSWVISILRLLKFKLLCLRQKL